MKNTRQSASKGAMILKNDIRIPRPSDELCRWLLARFKFRNPMYEQAMRYSPYSSAPANVPEFIRFAMYDHETDTLSIPRGFSAKVLPKHLRKEWDSYALSDNRTSVPAEFPKPLIGMNADQREHIDAFKQAIKQPNFYGGAAFVSGTGTGKTIAQAAAAQETGNRTLILCHTNLIRDTWITDLNKYYGLSKKDIGLIQQNTFRIGTAFTLASIRTLGSRKHMWAEIFAKFGTVILDEADIVAGATVSDFIAACPAKYMIGATATVQSGAKSFYLTALFGKAVSKIEISAANTTTSMALTDVVEHRTGFEYVCEDYRDLDTHELLDELTMDTVRNRQIIEIAHEEWRKSKYNSVLVVTNRLLHVEGLLELARDMGVKKPVRLTGETNTSRQLAERTVLKILSREHRFVVASLNAIKRGVNINPMNRLIVAAPLLNETDVEQIIGRIRRTYANKQDCIVHYMVDIKTPYLYSKYKKVCIPVFRKLQVPRFVNRFIA